MPRNKADRSRYNISRYFDPIGSILNIRRHLQYHSAGFISERAQFHQQIIDDLVLQSHVIPRPQERPKACIVIGGAGSGKSLVVDKLKQKRPMVCIDSDQIKLKMAEHEHARDPSLSKTQWLDTLQREAVLVRQEMLYQSIRNKNDLILESVGSEPRSIQDSIDALKKAGYEVELHLVDVTESVVLDRVAERNKSSERQVPLSYAKKSNRRAKATYEKLSRNNHGEIDAHRWSNNSSEPQLDDHEEINECFETLIKTLDESRQIIIKNLTPRDRDQQQISEHLNNLKQLQALPESERNAHAMLMALISDIAIFPEIYSGRDKELSKLYRLIDTNDFHVYFTSIQRKGPTKSHGSIMIGSPKLESGISMSAAGDPRRGKIHLPADFHTRLIEQLKRQEVFPDEVVQQLGSKEEVLAILQSKEKGKPFYDSYSLQLLITHCAPDLLSEYTDTIQFAPKYSRGFELWDKPRSSLQSKDTLLFNKQFPVFLEEQTYSTLSRGLGHLHHGITRKVAIREQHHVACSTVLQRWVNLSAHKRQLDGRRGLLYSKESAFWQYDESSLSKRGGNCNTISTHLLGRNAETASIFNIGRGKGGQIEFPPVRTPKADKIRETRSGNVYSEMLWESHLAKLIVHNPQPYQSTVLKVNNKIIELISGLNESSKKLLIKGIQNNFAEFNVNQDDPIVFLTNKLKSTEPKDIYRSILFHKDFFEDIFTKPVSDALRDRYEYFSMRPSSMFGYSARGAERGGCLLDSHPGIGGMRLHYIELNLHHDSFNVDYPASPASVRSSFLDLQKRFSDIDGQTARSDTFKDRMIQYDALFYSGASGSTTTILPYVFNTILADDPIAQEDYILARAGASSYAGHHSMFEIVAPIKHMKLNYFEQFETLSSKSEDLYDRILTARFKRFMHHQSPSEQLSPYKQCIVNFKSDLIEMNNHLQTYKGATTKLNPECEVEAQLKDLMMIIHKKIDDLHKNKRTEKYEFLLTIKSKLNNCDLTNLSDVEDLLTYLERSKDFNVDIFQGRTSFSRFKSKSGERITETQWVVDQVHHFMSLIKEDLTAKLQLEETMGELGATSIEAESDTVLVEATDLVTPPPSMMANLKKRVQRIRSEHSESSDSELQQTAEKGGGRSS